MIESSYSRALFTALALHVGFFCLLCIETVNTQPALQKEAKNQTGITMPLDNAEPEKAPIVKAHAIDSQAVMETMNRIKQQKAKAREAEQARQALLKKEADRLRMLRQKEQQRLEQLQQEALKTAALQKKKRQEEQQQLKQIAAQAAAEKARVAALQAEQKALEAKKLQAEKEVAAKEAARLQAEKEAAAKEAAKNQALQQAKLAGEIDKYKALIINAIGQRWILPENVNPQLSTQFRIRLAPNGTVLDVTLTKSSGDTLLDRSAQTAIYKASPLPVPVDPATFELFRDISLTVRPEKIRG